MLIDPVLSSLSCVCFIDCDGTLRFLIEDVVLFCMKEIFGGRCACREAFDFCVAVVGDNGSGLIDCAFS